MFSNFIFVNIALSTIGTGFAGTTVGTEAVTMIIIQTLRAGPGSDITVGHSFVLFGISTMFIGITL